MSATFKNSKKKTQLELRKFMNEHRSKQKNTKEVDSPLAKFNDQGQLTCVLCNTVVRSKAVWTVHVNAKVHKQNVEIARKLKEKTNNFTTPLKRSLSPPIVDVPEKKIKGILKNSNNAESDTKKSHNDTKGNKLPDDFFDVKASQKSSSAHDKKLDTIETEDIMENKDTTLPEGFFDDPKLDAKARNQEYKDPIEAEWEQFMKAIKEADNESNAIIAEDQEESTTERQIDEIDEQMKKLSRVLDLEKKKVEIITISNETKDLEMDEQNEEEVGDGFDEFFDWRAKKSFK